MSPKLIFLCVCVAITATALAKIEKGKPNPKALSFVHATNNTAVPSVTYVADAVECLEEAYSIYGDDQNRAALYAALFEEKHNGSWNVVVGYSAVYLKSEIYVEATVLDDGKDKKSKSSEEEDNNKLFLIYSLN